MSSAILILVTLTLSSVVSPHLAAAAAAADDDNDDDDGDGIDDENSTTVVAGWSVSIPSSEDAGTAVTVGNSTTTWSTVSAAEDVNSTWTTQPAEIQSLPPTSMKWWFRVLSPIFIALTTVGNPLSIVTLQSPLFRLNVDVKTSTCSNLVISPA